MRERFLAWVSTLLIIVGIILPAAHSLAAQRAADGASWSVTGSSPTYANGNTTVTYTIHKNGNPQDLSHWTLALCGDVNVRSASPDYQEDGYDPTTGVTGLKWEADGLGGLDDGDTFTVTYEGLWLPGTQSYASKAGRTNYEGTTDGISCTEAAPSFTVRKTVSADPEEAGGDTLTLTGGGTAHYHYTVTNTGNVPLTLHSASDNMIDTLDKTDFSSLSIPVGGAVTASASKSFPELNPGDAGTAEENTFSAAVAWEGMVFGPKTDTATVINQPPSVNVDFTVGKEVAASSDGPWSSAITLQESGTAYYRYTVTNTGTVPITISSAEDNVLGSIAFSPTTLNPGESATGTADRSFSNTTPGADDIVEINTIDVGVTYDDTTYGPKSDSATVTVRAPAVNLDFDLVKAVDDADYGQGSTSLTLVGGGDAYYTYTIRNTGNVTFEITSAVDDKLGSVTFEKTTLEPGEETVAYKHKNFPEPTERQEETNTITVRVQYGTQTKEKQASATVITLPRPMEGEPRFTVVKKVNTTNNAQNGMDEVSLVDGGTVYYFYTITNTGSVTLWLDSVEDNQIISLDAGDFSDTELSPGEKATATVQKTFDSLAPGSEDESETNTVTVYTTDWNGRRHGPKTDSATVINRALLALELSELCSDDPSESRKWQVSNANDRTVEFTWTLLEDPDQTGTLSVGANQTVDFSTNAVSGTNTVRITVGDHTHDLAESTAPECAAPSFTVEKKVNAEDDRETAGDEVTLVNGGTVYYFYTITNTGNIPLLLGDAVDDKLGEVPFLNPEEDENFHILNPGESWTATLSKTFSAPASREVEVNTITVTMRDARENRYGPRTAQATVYNNPRRSPPPPSPNFTVTKTVSATDDPATGAESITLENGGTAYYFYTITNTGGTMLELTSAVDDKLGEITFSDTTLSPGESATTTASKTFSTLNRDDEPQTETNTISVTMAYGSTQVGPKTDSATVVNNPPEARPDFEVTKKVSTTNNPATGQGSVTIEAGQTVYYFYTVTNTGNTTLTIEEAMDDKLGEISFSPTMLAPGETAMATSAKTFADPAVASETNVVSITTTDGTTVIGPKTDTASVIIQGTGVEPKGTVLVRVLDASDRNPVPVPIADADVIFTGGLTGTTNENGEILFTDLDFGDYTATATAVDPENPTPDTVQSGSGATTITVAEPNGSITILLAWEPPLAAPGSISGRICAPHPPGAEITATGPGGETMTVTIPSDGVLGVWKPYNFTELTPGTWTITLKAPGAEPVSLTVTVLNGQVTQAGDFTLACTGGSGPAKPPGWIFYLSGAIMVTTGLVIRRRIRKEVRA